MSNANELLEELEPRSRTEAYLKNCALACGCDGLPEPLSTTDKLLYHLAEQLASGGGSGGGSQADWNAKEGEPGHVLHRPFYENGTEIKTLLDTTVTVASNQFQCSETVNLTGGKTYTVIWDGTEYECVGGEIAFQGDPAVALGNPYFLGGENNGLPFFFGSMTLNGACAGAAMTNGSHTIKITEEATVYKKLDECYLPDIVQPYVFKVPASIVSGGIIQDNITIEAGALVAEIANILWYGGTVLIDSSHIPAFVNLGMYRQKVNWWGYSDGCLAMAYGRHGSDFTIQVTGGTWTPPTE